MSIKEEIDFAKEELTQDEKLLASLIKVERFYKKNKVLVLGLTAILVFGGIGYGVMNYMKNVRLTKANEALLALQKNPADAAALKTLESNDPALAELYRLQRAVADKKVDILKSLTGSKDPTVADLAQYHAAAVEKSEKELKSYRMVENSLLKDFALFDEAYLLNRAGKTEQARKLLAAIPKDAPLKKAAELLSHYGTAAQTGTQK